MEVIMPSSSDLKRGIRFLHESSPYTVADVAFQTPSARGANTLVKVKARNMETGQLQHFTFRAGERLDDPDIETLKVQFLYSDDDLYHFMDMETYEQHALAKDSLGGTEDYLVEEIEAKLVVFNGRPISLDLPKAIDMVVAECEPAFKGDTVTNVQKTAMLETGLEIQVPLFINVGDVVRVDTTEARYVERVRR